MSPKQGMYASTPELPRYGTPQSYAQPQRGPPPSSDQQARMGAGISRPNSQPMSYLPGPPGSSAREKQHNGPTPPHAEQYGHREDAPSRHPPGYSPDQRSHLYKYEEQHAPHPQHQPLPYLSDRERERERELEWEQRERQSREMEMKDRERRERANTGASDPGSSLPDLRTADYRHPQQGAPPLQHQLHSYGRQPDSRDSRELRDPRDHAAWPPRPGYEQSRPYDPGRPNDYHPSNNQPPPPPPPPPSQYSIHGPPASATQDRYHPTSLPPTHHMVSGGPSPYESSDHSRTGLVHSSEVPRRAPAGLTTSYPESRAGVQNQQLQQGPLQHGGAPGRPRPTDEAPLPPSVAYSGSAGGSGGPAPGSYDGQPSRQRSSEDAAAYPPRNLLAIQEINRRGRVSPMPQAVQGAQPQMHGPTGEPSIKSEFGRMYMGIGNGVGMGLSSPITSGASLPFSNGGPGGHTAALRRESADNMGLDASSDPQAKPAKGKRRKALKDEPGKVLSADDNGSGRVTPSSKPKRAKTAHHHHHHHHPAHHHHHHPDTSSTLVTALPSLKTGKGATPIPLPPSVGGPPRDFVTAQFSQAASRPAIQPPLRVSSPQQAEHGQLLLPTKRTTNGTLAPIQAAPAVIKPKQIILSQAVVDSVADQPRNYLGDVLYEPKLKAARKCDPLTGRPPRYPYSTTPRPLPLDMIKDKANSVLTVKISKVFLQRAPREEITYRRALWGTDIYTDDSDVIAACIHGGWIRGEWPDDVDVDLLSLSEQADASGSNNTRETAGGRKRSTAATATAAAATAVAETRVEPIPDELTAPPRTGPMEIPPEKDLHVTLVILPTLLKYSATTRFGIRSREWGGQPHQQHQMHDGMSFKVLKLRWVTNGAGAQSRLRGKARRERMRQAMREVELASSVGKNELPQISAPLVFSGDDDGDASNGVLKQCYQPLPRKFVAQDAGAVGDGDKENRPGPAELADATISLKEDLVASSRPQADTAVIDSLVASDAGVAALSAMSEAAAVAAAAAAEDPDTTMTDAGADD
ncbi:hypothetical protein SEPCBS119000_000935 [Sporothrix epigloea]|uniref:Uncharacterized protein n=1 Tax=Sporothrix epigloea TaxID=1892477 RepID=A0ABP0D916_9PEZI